MTNPLILTVAFHPDDQARFDTLRQQHFPPEHNHIPAHLTLFHHLPGNQVDSVQDSLVLACGRQGCLVVDVTGLRSLGRGAAYTLACPALSAVRAGLARHWHDSLTAQDRQGWRPHVTVQNKVTAAEASSLLATMQAAFVPFVVRAEGLSLWRYLGGPWSLVGHYPFTPGA